MTRVKGDKAALVLVASARSDRPRVTYAHFVAPSATAGAVAVKTAAASCAVKAAVRRQSVLCARACARIRARAND